MNSKQIEIFMKLAGQKLAKDFETGSSEVRRLGAQLLLSEVLEYVIKGLGVAPVVNGQKITEPDKLQYEDLKEPDRLEMLDGLADVAYTMYWNAVAFGMPLEEAFDMVCANNLEKFVALASWTGATGIVTQNDWDLGRNISWPSEVVTVEVVQVAGTYYAVGKDKNGKVRKPSSYQSVELAALL